MEDMSNVMNNPDAAARVDLTVETDAVNPIVTETKGTIGNSIPANLKESDITVGGHPIPSIEQLAKATGHEINTDMLKIESEKEAPKKGRFGSPDGAKTEKEPSGDPKPVEKAGSRFLSPSQVKEAGLDNASGETIDIRQEVAKRNAEQYAAAQKASNDALSGILQGVLKGEEERNQRMTNTLNADEETKNKILGDEVNNPNLMSYTPESTKQKISEEERKKADRQSGNPGIDPYELMPSYDEDEPEKPKDEEEAPDPTSDEYAEYIQNLETVTDMEPTKGYAINRIREAGVTIVETNPNKSVNNLGNQAFNNAIANFKRDNFSKVTVPLVNSGFMADVVGTGVVDLQNLYINVDQNMSTYDYQLEQMATVIKNVVGTSPKINPMQLKNSIHFQDYNMLAFGHICATLKTVETVANCTECGKPFHITSNPINLLINMDELYEKRMAIENAANIEENSLMTSTRLVTTSVGVKVTLSHPSYAELVRSIRGFQDYSGNLTAADRRRFESMLNTLYMIRKVRLPNGIESNNIYQHYEALMLLGQRDMDMVNREIEDMRKDIIVPKFGIREVVCPHCKRVVKNIAYDSLLELLFFHLSVDAFLNPANSTTKKSNARESNGSEKSSEA